MVFTRLDEDEKEAFFGLLDEYFQSRPDIFSNISTDSSGNSLRAPSPSSTSSATPANAASSAVQRALASHPEATASIVSAGLRHGVNKRSPMGAAVSNPAIANSIGRVAAASLAFNKPGQQSNSPPPAPGRVPSIASTASQSRSESPPPPPSRAPAPSPRTSGVSGLLSTRKFGDVDTSSAKNAFASLRSSTANKNAPAPEPVLPSAFAKRNTANTIQPPPTRRVTSDTAPPPPPRRHAQEEPPEEEGEWAEALYEYTSEDTGDLPLTVGQRVKIVTKDSDDWWTGEIDGRSGLFPAAYVKIF